MFKMLSGHFTQWFHLSKENSVIFATENIESLFTLRKEIDGKLIYTIDTFALRLSAIILSAQVDASLHWCCSFNRVQQVLCMRGEQDCAFLLPTL